MELSEIRIQLLVVSILVILASILIAISFLGSGQIEGLMHDGFVIERNYPLVWFAPINDPNKPDWEILPQEAKAGEVILSKRNELGILSNFAATPFELDGKRYASVEGLWQMMLYPEGPDDERAITRSGCNSERNCGNAGTNYGCTRRRCDSYGAA